MLMILIGLLAMNAEAYERVAMKRTVLVEKFKVNELVTKAPELKAGEHRIVIKRNNGKMIEVPFHVVKATRCTGKFWAYFPNANQSAWQPTSAASNGFAVGFSAVVDGISRYVYFYGIDLSQTPSIGKIAIYGEDSEILEEGTGTVQWVKDSNLITHKEVIVGFNALPFRYNFDDKKGERNLINHINFSRNMASIAFLSNDKNNFAFCNEQRISNMIITSYSYSYEAYMGIVLRDEDHSAIDWLEKGDKWILIQDKTLSLRGKNIPASMEIFNY